MSSQKSIRGHDSPITTVDVLFDGRCFATGGYDGRVILWRSLIDIEWYFEAPDLVNHVRFDQGGNRLAAACADGKVYIFELSSGSVVTILGPMGDDANAIAWHPNQDNLLAVVADAWDTDVYIWDVSSRERYASLSGHEHGVFAVCFNPSGSKLATAAEDGTGRIWSLNGKLLCKLQHPGDPETIDWSSDGQYVATGCDDKVLRLWDPNTGNLVRSSDVANSKVGFVKFAKGAQELLAGSYDGYMRLHRVSDLAVVRELRAPFQWERSAAFMPQGDIIVGSFGSMPIVHKKGEVPSDAGRTFGINSIAAIHSDGADPDIDTLTVIGRDDGNVVDVEKGEHLYRHSSIVNCVVFSPNRRFLASADYQGEIKIWDVVSREMYATTHLSSGPINSLAWSPRETNGEDMLIASAGYDGVIRWWTQSLELVAEGYGHSGPIKSISWSPVTDVLVAGSSDDSISGWKDRKMLYRHRAEDLVLVNSVSASTFDETFASASRDGRIRVWNTALGQLIEMLPEVHLKSVKAVALASDGNHILSGSYDGNAILWSRNEDDWTWVELRLHGKPGVPAVTFRGSTALTAGWDGTVGAWNLRGQLVAHYKLNKL